MAKLITHHDPYHIHKTLGLLSLMSFLYHLCRLLFAPHSSFNHYVEQNTQGKLEVSTWASMMTVDFVTLCLHLSLSWTSLLLPLPEKRMHSKPMIWPEFRAHSICFATRQILFGFAVVLDWLPRAGVYHGQRWWSGFGFEMQLVLEALLKGALVAATSIAASRITDVLGSRDERTTNAMPYPDGTSEEAQRVVKWYYTESQIFAVLGLVPDWQGITFACLYPIQGAPFLMTLVRKGKLGAWGYHLIYTATLCVTNFVHISGLLRELLWHSLGSGGISKLLDTIGYAEPRMTSSPPLVYMAGSAALLFTFKLWNPLRTRLPNLVGTQYAGAVTHFLLVLLGVTLNRVVFLPVCTRYANVAVIVVLIPVLVWRRLCFIGEVLLTWWSVWRETKPSTSDK